MWGRIMRWIFVNSLNKIGRKNEIYQMRRNYYVNSEIFFFVFERRMFKLQGGMLNIQVFQFVFNSLLYFFHFTNVGIIIQHNMRSEGIGSRAQPPGMNMVDVLYSIEP